MQNVKSHGRFPIPIVSNETDEIKAHRFIFSFLIHAVESEV